MPCPCRASAVLRPCRSESDFSRPRHSTAGTRHGFGMAVVHEHRPSRDGLWATYPGSAPSGYYAEFHEGCHQNLKLKCSWSLWNQAAFVMDVEKLIVLVREHECCINYSTNIYWTTAYEDLNYLNAELNPICHLLSLIGAHHILHVSRLRVKLSLLPCMHSDVCYKVDQHAANVERVATDMQYHMLSLNTI